MSFVLLRNGGSEEPGQRRSLVPYLLMAIWLQVCLLVGLLLSPYFAGSRPARLLRSGNPNARLARYRSSLCDPGRDPRRGAPAPALDVRSVDGQRLTTAGLAGRRVLLVFGKGDSG